MPPATLGPRREPPPAWEEAGVPTSKFQSSVLQCLARNSKAGAISCPPLSAVGSVHEGDAKSELRAGTPKRGYQCTTPWNNNLNFGGNVNVHALSESGRPTESANGLVGRAALSIWEPFGGLRCLQPPAWGCLRGARELLPSCLRIEGVPAPLVQVTTATMRTC